MKVIAVFLTLLAVSLAAPTDSVIADVKPAVLETAKDTEKPVEKDVVVNPSSDSSSEDKVVDKAEAAPVVQVADPEEKEPIIVVATSVDEDKKDEEPQTEEEKLSSDRDIGAICRASTGATDEQIAAISKDPVKDAPQAVKCYVKCMGQESGVVKDEVLQMDVFRKTKPSSLTVEEFETISETCADFPTGTDDPCDSAYLRYSCYFRASGEKIRIS